jgi:hypothetical protein
VSGPTTVLAAPRGILQPCCAWLQVKAVLTQAARTQAELEALFGRLLRAHPLLAPLGDAKAVKYVVWSVLAAPLLALLIPALLLPVSHYNMLISCPAKRSLMLCRLALLARVQPLRGTTCQQHCDVGCGRCCQVRADFPHFCSKPRAEEEGAGAAGGQQQRRPRQRVQSQEGEAIGAPFTSATARFPLTWSSGSRHCLDGSAP